MPLKECTNKDGVKGWSWGNGGCIVGKDAKKKAIKVGLAVEGEEKFSKIMKSHSTKEEYELAKSVLRADHMDAIYGKARIRFAEDPATHQIMWKILGTDFYFESFDLALKFKTLTDTGMGWKKAAAEVFTLPNPDPTPEAGYEERLKEQERSVNPSVKNSPICQPSLK